MNARAYQVSIVVLGTLLEWAEYVFYAYMAPTLALVFFPAEAPKAIALLYTFGIFAFGFLMRPLGAVLFGHIGDRIGRKPALVMSMSLMALATLGIGLCPSYARVGLLAPILLTLFRLLQGLSVGGEYHGAGIYLVETAERRPALAGAWVSFGAGAGTVVGAFAASWVATEGMPTYAWRIPFIVGACAYGLCFLLRRQLTESLSDEDRLQAHTITFGSLIRTWRTPFIRVMGISATVAMNLYICNIYFLTHLTSHVGLDAQLAHRFVFWGQLLVTFLIPPAAILSEKIGSARQVQLGCIMIGLWAPVMFWISGFEGGALIAIIGYALTYAFTCGPMFKVLHDSFSPAIRYRGIGLAWNLSAVIFSGTALFAAHSLTLLTKNALAPAWYLCGIALLTGWVCRTKKNL